MMGVWLGVEGRYLVVPHAPIHLDGLGEGAVGLEALDPVSMLRRVPAEAW